MKLLTNEAVTGRHTTAQATFHNVNLIDTVAGTIHRIQTEDGDLLWPDAWRKIIVKFMLRQTFKADLVGYGDGDRNATVYVVDPDSDYFARHMTLPPLDLSSYRLRITEYGVDTDTFEDQ